MTSRSRPSRRPLQLGGLLLAAAALGTVTAPAASAMVDNTEPGAQTPQQAPAERPRVLTLAADGFTGTADDPVHFGEGKLQVSIAPEPAEDATTTPADQLADDAPDMAGAVVLVTVTSVDEYSPANYPVDEGDTATCTTAADGSCTLTGPVQMVDETGQLRLWPGMEFEVKQTTAPSSLLYDLPPAGHDVFHGVVDFSLSLALAPTSSQTRDGDAVLRFYDPARTLAGGSNGTAAGAPAPGSSAAAPTTDPTTAGASGTGAAGTGTPGTGTATATPALATTGADVGPMAAVGGGLLVAGAAGLVLARRRAPR